jgi:hypothetical protein
VDVGQVNWSRVILGGFVAGLVMSVSQFILTVPVLGTQMQAELTKRTLPPMGGAVVTFYSIMDFIVGVVTVWLYAAIRPRYGPGPRTAIYAGLSVWFLAYFRSRFGFVAMGVFPIGLMALAVLWAFVEMILASLAGAWLYKE